MDPKTLSFLSLILFPAWIVVNNVNCGSTKVTQWVPRRHKMLTHWQERLFCKVTSVFIHSFIEWLDTFSYLLRPADVTVKQVSNIRCFAIDIGKYLILLSCRLSMECLCALQLETALATLVITWFTLDDGQWRSRYRSSDQCIINVFRSSERYNGWFREQLRHRFTFFQFLSNDDGRCLKSSLKRDGKWEQDEPIGWSFFLCIQGGYFC